jgi:hypothetical protein
MLREVRQGGSVEFGNPIRLSEDAATYPVLAAVDGGLLAVWATGGPASTIRVARVPLP